MEYYNHDRNKPAFRMQTIRRYYRIDRRQISMLRFIFEAYEGVAIVTTIDSAKGIVVLRIAPGCEDIAHAVMDDFSRQFLVEPYDDKVGVKYSFNE